MSLANDRSNNVLPSSTNSGGRHKADIGWKEWLKKLKTKQMWLGEYDYAALFIPDIPYLTKPREQPFYGTESKLPLLLLIILGFQHALAMVGSVVAPPILLSGPGGAALTTSQAQYLVSASLIWCSVGTVAQVRRFRIFGTKYRCGTGVISVTGTSFAFVSVGLSYFTTAYKDGTCEMAPDGNRLPCPKALGAILGTATLTGIVPIVVSFLPPKLLKRLFPPLVTGLMLTMIGADLVGTAVLNWAGGSGPCRTDHTIPCPSADGPHPQLWGSAPLIGLGFTSFIVIILCEIFGSTFFKSTSVFIGLVTGMIVAAATGYFDSSVIESAPGVTFLWTHTFPLSIKGELILPMLAAWTVIIAEAIGNVTASCDVSRISLGDEDFETRLQGGLLADALSSALAGLMFISPLTTLSQNAGVIVLTQNASRQVGYACAAFLFLMGFIAKFSSIFVAMPASTLGGFTTFLFAAVGVAGIRILAMCEWTRRTRFIATCALSLGFASLCVPDWFSYFFTYSGSNTGLRGLIEAIELIVEQPYLIASLIALIMNAFLPFSKTSTTTTSSETQLAELTSENKVSLRSTVTEV